MKIIKKLKLNSLIKIIFLLVFVTSCATPQEQPVCDKGVGINNTEIQPQKNDFEQTLDLANKENSDAQIMLAYAYFSGDNLNVRKSYKKAAKWYKRATKSKDNIINKGLALNNLGDMYENGYGVRKNYKKAMQLYKKAIRTGYTFSYASIGQLYHKGRGVRRNYKKAYALYKIALKQNDSEVVENALKKVEAKLTTKQKQRAMKYKFKYLLK